MRKISVFLIAILASAFFLVVPALADNQSDLQLFGTKTSNDSGDGDCYCRQCGVTTNGRTNCNPIVLLDNVNPMFCARQNNDTVQCTYKSKVNYCCCKVDPGGAFGCKKATNYSDSTYCNASIYEDPSFNPQPRATDNATDFFANAGSCQCKAATHVSITFKTLEVNQLDSECDTNEIQQKINPLYSNCVKNRVADEACDCLSGDLKDRDNSPTTEINSLWAQDCERLPKYRAYSCQWVPADLSAYETEDGYEVRSIDQCAPSAALKSGGTGTSVDNQLRVSTADLQKNALSMNQLTKFLAEGGSASQAVRSIIGQGIRVLMAFMGTILLILYIYAAILWMTAAGNTEQIEKAKTILIWSTAGAAAMLGSYLVASAVFTILKSKPVV